MKVIALIETIKLYRRNVWSEVKMSEYEIKSNLSEKQIEADVAEYFGWISRKSPFRLLDINEQLTGSDKKFYDSGFAFFMQFKVSNGLESISKVPSSKRKNKSKLEDIREFRNKLNIYDDPTLFFGLRKMASTAYDYQHNILIQYANTNFSQAFYVAPLHLDKDRYYDCLFNSTFRFLNYPFYNRNIRLYDGIWISHIGNIPFLKEHMSIIPHERVITHEHYYSFSPTGCDIGWHSPELLSEEPSRLSDMLSKTIASCIKDDLFLELDELERKIQVFSNEEVTKKNEDLISQIQRKGQVLYKRDGIRMFLLLCNKEFVTRYKDMII